MSNPVKAKDPLNALQSLVNDVLVQTGKALRASRKDAQGHLLTQAPETMPSKLPDTIRSFHSALDEIEFEILKAKSVLLRDLNQVQERKRLLIKTEPQPVELQPKQPNPVDLDSPPSTMIKGEAMSVDAAPKPPMAPFPNMSIDFPNTHPMDVTMKGLDSQPQPTLPMSIDLPSENGIASRLAGQMTVGDAHIDMTNPSGIPNPSGMNFTDMEFSLAPPLPTSESQALPGTADTAFDLTTFAPSDKMNQMVPLPMNPAGLVDQGIAPDSNTQEKVEGKKGEAADSSKFHDLFGKDSGAADGMDFDFSLGGERDTFDDLMNDRDGTFDLMDGNNGGGGGNLSGTGTGGFDAPFFGLEKTDQP